MIRLLTVTMALLAALQYASAACDNQCSGHGTCGIDDVCTCYDNFRMGMEEGGDCSDRVCPFEIAWVDTPDKTGRVHKYAECAGRGMCDRTTGECQCFDGYEGKACQRSVCPNDCSGHGVCEYIEDMGFGVVPADSGAKGFSLDLPTYDNHHFDAAKTRGCVCDPQWFGADCSLRMCPFGTDILAHRLNMEREQRYQVQKIEFVFHANVVDFEFTDSPTMAPTMAPTGGSTPAPTPGPILGQTFALGFKSKLNETFFTQPIVFDTDTMHTAVKNALLNLPNEVVDDVEVDTDVDEDCKVTLTITFTGSAVQGPQNLLMVSAFECGDGCTPKVTGLDYIQDYTPDESSIAQLVAADLHSYECGRRGKCDYMTGLCQCFEGYTGEACNVQTALV